MTDDRFLLRPAVNADIPALQALIERSVRVLQKEQYTEAQREGALGHALGLDTQLVADGTYFVACPRAEPECIVASGGWSFRGTLFGSDGAPDRTAARLDPSQDAAKIRAIFVDPLWARQGLGSLLLRHCEQAALAAGFTRFEMGSTLTGVPLYRKLGYVETGRIGVPLPNGEVLAVVCMGRNAKAD